MAGFLGLTLCLCLCLCFWRTHCQILQAPADPEDGYLDLTEYPLPANFGGVFTYPTSVTQVYDEGVPMTIAWNTTYQHISLYIAYVRNISLAAPVDGAGNSQRQLQSESGSHRTIWAAFFRPSTNGSLNSEHSLRLERHVLLGRIMRSRLQRSISAPHRQQPRHLARGHSRGLLERLLLDTSFLPP
jgi:hypothetical protein